MIVSSDQESSIRPRRGHAAFARPEPELGGDPRRRRRAGARRGVRLTAPTVGYTLDPAIADRPERLVHRQRLAHVADRRRRRVGRRRPAASTRRSRRTGRSRALHGRPTPWARPARCRSRCAVTRPRRRRRRALTPTAIGAWYSPRTVTLTGADGAVGSGVASTEYSLDGGAWTPYLGAFFVGTFGPHTLSFRSTDAAGNVEAAKT